MKKKFLLLPLIYLLNITTLLGMNKEDVGNLDILPDEIIVAILRKCDKETVKNLRLTNNKFQQIFDTKIIQKLKIKNENKEYFITHFNKSDFLSKIKELDLSESGAMFDDLKGLSVLSGLEILNLDMIGDEVGNLGDSQNFCLNLPNLRTLIFSRSTLTDDHISSITNLINLTKLDLKSTMLTDEAISYLTILTNLNTLDITNTSISKGRVKKLTQIENINFGQDSTESTEEYMSQNLSSSDDE